MIWRRALKYPVLIVGIILFAIYWNDPNTKEYWSKYNRRYIPSTCDAVKDRVEKKAPESWEMKCPTIQLLKIKIESQAKEDRPVLVRQAVYKELANSYSTLGRLSNPETLEYLKNIEVTIVNKYLSVKSKTDGKAVVEMLSKKNPKDIANHLRLTVKVKEIKK